MIKEEWRPVTGYEGKYEVSNMGRVRGLDRVSCRKTSPIFVKGVVLSQLAMPNGYTSVQLRSDGKQTRFYVHRLVADAFIPNPTNLPEVNHKDECKCNNIVSNLEWCSRSYNLKYAGGASRRVNARKKAVIQKSGGVTVAVYESVNAAARSLGVSPSNVSRCCRRIKNQTRIHGFEISFKPLNGGDAQ